MFRLDVGRVKVAQAHSWSKALMLRRRRPDVGGTRSELRSTSLNCGLLSCLRRRHRGNVATFTSDITGESGPRYMSDMFQHRECSVKPTFISESTFSEHLLLRTVTMVYLVRRCQRSTRCQACGLGSPTWTPVGQS
jgi:hypothetical protein